MRKRSEKKQRACTEDADAESSEDAESEEGPDSGYKDQQGEGTRHESGTESTGYEDEVLVLSTAHGQHQDTAQPIRNYSLIE